MSAELTSVTLVVPSMVGGGTERAILMLANYWASRDITVTLVLFVREGVLLDELHPKIQVYSLETSNCVRQVSRLTEYFNEAKPAVVMCALNPANAVATFARCLSRHDFRLVLSVHNHMGSKYAHAPSFLNPLRRMLLSYILKRADAVVAVSSAIADYLVETLRVGRDRVCVIYNPVVVSDVSKLDPPHQWLTEKDRPVLIAAGRLTRQKRFSLLLEALLHLPEEVRLIIIGEGEDRELLEKSIKEKHLETRVCLPGFQETPNDWFVHADCYVMSSDWEGFPFVLLEALAAGLQVVSTDCLSGPRELLAGGKFGQLVPCADAERLAVAISTTLREPIDSSLLQSRAAEFDISKVAESYASCLIG